MATHSRVLAWRIPGAGSLVGCHLWGRTELNTTEVTQQQQQQLDTDCTESVDCFGQFTHFHLLILLIHEHGLFLIHGIFLHLFLSSLTSFISVFQSSIYRSFVSLDRFIPKYFILFVPVVNGITSLIFLFSHCQCIGMQGITCNFTVFIDQLQ